MSSPIKYSLSDLLTLMARLREPDYGCPWDLAQSYKTIAPSTLEEAYEVVDAIEHNDDKQLKEELGDLLFQIVFYSQLGKEEDKFDFHEIVSALTEKLVRRHPHVFPDGTLASRIDLGQLDADNDDTKNKNIQDDIELKIKETWDRTKAGERQQKGHNSLMDDVPVALPSTTRAYKLQKRAAAVNFDWSNTEGVYDKVKEEIAELQIAIADLQDQNVLGIRGINTSQLKQAKKEAVEEELGDVFFTLINISRHLKVDPETALRKANSKFELRFRYLENLAQQQSKDIAVQSPKILQEWWELAKKSLST